jgi:integrase
VLFESGARAEELLSLLIEDVEIVVDGEAIILHFRRSKTKEGIRNPIIVRSAPALIHYLQTHSEWGKYLPQ